MATVHGEGVRFEMQAASGEWVDITKCVGSVELIDEDGDAVFLPAGEYKVDVTVCDLREVVRVASGRAIAAKPIGE